MKVSLACLELAFLIAKVEWFFYLLIWENDLASYIWSVSYNKYSQTSQYCLLAAYSFELDIWVEQGNLMIEAESIVEKNNL